MCPMFELLKEAPPRAGFFETDRYEAVRRHLPDELRVAVAFAYTFGWRVRSEVLTLERRHVDLRAGTVRRPDRLPYSGTQDAPRRTTGSRASSRPPHGAGHPVCVPEPVGAVRRSSAWRLSQSLGDSLPKGRVPGHTETRLTSLRRAEYGASGASPRSVAMKITGHRTESAWYRRYAIVSDADCSPGCVRSAHRGHNTGHSRLVLIIAPVA